MIIKNITIENFQCYYERQKLEFSEGLNIVIANGGKGKSKLFNAFYWVLFGDIYITSVGWCNTNGLPFSSKFAMQSYEFLNERALFNTNVGDKVVASVQLELDDDKGCNYVIERSVSATRLDFDNWHSDEAWDVTQSILRVSFDSPTGTKIFNDLMAEDKIKQLFPDGIRDYIWFQGESLESLIDFRKKETLKAAVKHISYFPYYEKLSEIITKSKVKIESLESKKLKEENKHNQTVQTLVSNKEKYSRLLKEEVEKKNVIEERINTINLALADDENKIKGLAQFSGLVQKYNNCETEIIRLVNEITEKDNFQRRKLPALWILNGIGPMLSECKKIIEKHKEEEYTVPEKKYLDNPSRAKLEEILRDKKCFVCGTEFLENDAPYHYITERLRLQEEYLREMEEYTTNMQFSKQFNMFVGKIQDYPDSLNLSISNIEKQYIDSEKDIERLLAQRRKKQDEKTSIDKEIEEIKRKHGINPIQQATQAEVFSSSIDASRKNLETQKRLLETSKKAISDYNKNFNEASSQLEKLGNAATLKKVAETEWKHISSFLEVVCKIVQEKARKELLRKIEERANDFYQKFTEHDQGYKGTVKIADDYSIEFDSGLNTSHEDRKKMSIINALLSLNQESLQTYYPFISDAPTSSFDHQTTYKYLMGIKDIFGQSIILTKDVDLQSSEYDNLRSQTKVSRIFNLESEIYSGDANRGRHEVSTKVVRLK